MDYRKEAVEEYNHWKSQLSQDLVSGELWRVDESSRMLFAVGNIMRVYHPACVTDEVIEGLRQGLEDALLRAEKEVCENSHVYEERIRERYIRWQDLYPIRVRK